MSSIERLIHLCDNDSELLGAIQELAQYREEKASWRKNWVKQEFARLSRRFEEVGRNERLR